MWLQSCDKGCTGEQPASQPSTACSLCSNGLLHVAPQNNDQSRFAAGPLWSSGSDSDRRINGSVAQMELFCDREVDEDLCDQLACLARAVWLPKPSLDLIGLMCILSSGLHCFMSY